MIKSKLLPDEAPEIDADFTTQIESLIEMGLIDLETAADACLEATGALSRDHGILTSRQLERKIRNEPKYCPSSDLTAIPKEVDSYLLSSSTDELVELANLRPMEEICLRLRIAGLNMKESASLLGIGRRRVAMHLRIARRKAINVFFDGPYAGWYEVYLSEIRRGR